MSKIFDVNKWQQKDQNKRCKPNAQEIATRCVCFFSLLVKQFRFEISISIIAIRLHKTIIHCGRVDKAEDFLNKEI